MPGITNLFLLLNLFYFISAANVSHLSHPTSTIFALHQGGPIVQYLTQGFHVNNGLRWCLNHKALVFVDSVLNTFSMYHPDNGKTYSLKITELNDDQLISATPVHFTNDKYILTTQKSLYLLTTHKNWEHMTYNIEFIMDILSESDMAVTGTKVDHQMNLVFGTKIKLNNTQPEVKETSELYRVDIQKKEVKELDTGFKEITAVCFDHTHKILFVADGLENVVYQYDYDRDSGKISNKRIMLNMANYKDYIQGEISALATDSKSYLYVGLKSSSSLFVYDYEKEEMYNRISIPSWQVTSLIFGGNFMETLYVGTERDIPYSLRNPQTGNIIAISGSGSKGQLEHSVKT